MHCSSCASEFGFLRKELGCEVCGFSFCSKCCKKREIPSKAGESKKQLICNKCYECCTNHKSKTGAASPPLAHKKRMAALKKQSYSIDSGANVSFFQSEWTNEKDKEIAERLLKLKREKVKNDLPSEDDIAERLAKLKGIDPAKYKAPPIQVYRPPDLRTSVEQTASLLNQVTMEVELDSRLIKPEDEIAARLARLRDEVSPKPTPEIDVSKLGVNKFQEEMDIDKSSAQFEQEDKSLSERTSKDINDLINDPEYKKLMLEIKKEKGDDNKESDDEEAAANELVEKLLAADVEELDNLNDDSEECISLSDKDSTEEFPWCVICTEDAKVRCFGCESDLYCMRCFKECHDSLDIKDHKTCPYLPPKTPPVL